MYHSAGSDHVIQRWQSGQSDGEETSCCDGISTPGVCAGVAAHKIGRASCRERV